MLLLRMPLKVSQLKNLQQNENSDLLIEDLKLNQFLKEPPLIGIKDQLHTLGE